MNDLEFLATMSDSHANVAARGGASRWARVAVAQPQLEGRMPLETAVAKWQQIYNLFHANGEDARDEVFTAVNGYFALNGCSPSGRYSRDIVTGSGVRVPVDAVVKITGRLEGDIRQFLRGMMLESYECLKYTTVLSGNEAALAKAESLGIPRHMVHLLADWFKDCEYFTADEQSVYGKVSQAVIAQAVSRKNQAAKLDGKRADLQADDPVVEPGFPPVSFASY